MRKIAKLMVLLAVVLSVAAIVPTMAGSCDPVNAGTNPC